MVMAGNESVPGALVDNAVSTKLQWLRQRREALREKLAEKNNELKTLCIEEAEITGVLPPEIPLEPGESPPTFHRKVGGTTFVHPQNSLNKLKTIDVEVSELELERQVQLEIAEAALSVFNDPTESKANRRKNRLAYQQSQRRVHELETELNFIRQGRNRAHRSAQLSVTQAESCNNIQPQVNVKHRTKKPRPPLDSTGNELVAPKSTGRGILHEPGISLSPLGTDDTKCTQLDKTTNAYSSRHGYDEHLNVSSSAYNRHYSSTFPRISPIDQQNIKIMEHDCNDNHNIYILPEQYRGRTYSHGSAGSRQGQGHYHRDNDRTHRPYVPNTYTEDERQTRYRHLQQLQKQQQDHQTQQGGHRLHYTGSFEYKHPDNADIVWKNSQGAYDRELRAPHYTPVTDYPAYYINSTLPQQQQPVSSQRRDRDVLLSSGSMRCTSSGAMTIDATGYWVRHNDDVHWVSVDEPALDRFGSLDRRRRNAQHNSCVSVDTQSRYRAVSAGSAQHKSGCSPDSNVTASPQQHHSVHLVPLSEQQSTLSNNKLLLRTQSLGSVETWQSSYSRDSHDDRDASTEYANNNRKNRQKEWYETSLDYATVSANSQINHNFIAVRKTASHSQSSPPPLARVKSNESSREISGPPTSPVNRRNRDKPEMRQHTVLQQPHPRYDQPVNSSVIRPKVLEIPAETTKTPSVDVCDDAVRPLGSPQNCTVVQPGIYQPYKEVTKPFEMSDFYKYSTKFRKRNEAVAQSQVGNDSPLLQENRLAEAISEDPDSYNLGQNDGNVTVSPVQRKLYQPVQRMTCQPYISSLR